MELRVKLANSADPDEIWHSLSKYPITGIPATKGIKRSLETSYTNGLSLE